jgi:hypothetical protein
MLFLYRDKSHNLHKIKAAPLRGTIRNGVEIKVQIDAHLLPSYPLFFYLNRSAIRAKKQKI